MNPPLRLMTYNVHSCVGTDRKLDPVRIAAVIAEYEPDVVALQELDLARPRSGMVDQAGVIATHLKMDFHFHPALRMAEEKYGDAILSRWPMHLRKVGELPTWSSWLAFEPRGALWVTIDTPAGPVQVINTHLGLSRLERLAQIKALLGPDWLGSSDCERPAVLCGDFNAVPGSAVLRRLRTSGWTDVQQSRFWARATYPSRYPVVRLDHVFLSPGMNVQRVDVPRTPLTRTASDHLPLIAELKW